MTDEELIAHWRGKAAADYDAAEEHKLKYRSYEDKGSLGAREQLSLFSQTLARGMILYQVAKELEDRTVRW